MSAVRTESIAQLKAGGVHSPRIIGISANAKERASPGFPILRKQAKISPAPQRKQTISAPFAQMFMRASSIARLFTLTVPGPPGTLSTPDKLMGESESAVPFFGTRGAEFSTGLIIRFVVETALLAWLSSPIYCAFAGCVSPTMTLPAISERIIDFNFEFLPQDMD